MTALLAALAATIGGPAGAVAAEPARPAAGPIPQPTFEEARVARLVTSTNATTAPGRGRVIERLSPISDRAGKPVKLLVLGSTRTADERIWLRVRLDVRPNGTSGWIARDDASVSVNRWRIDVSLRERTARVYRAGRLQRRFRVVVGAPRTPTPKGLFAVSQIVRQQDPGGFIGPWALHLTAHSKVLEEFGGGPGTIGLHGRAGASLADPLGTARSHGCVRLSNAQVSWLARTVDAGTPVRIR